MTKTVNEIRNAFLNFFASKGHQIVPSSPLVPNNDPTLMFTNAGMVQFKNVFTGAEKLAFSKATSSQKCVRAGGKHNDLDNVGYTARHHTFFEMLGNFSFGDYFKQKAIEFAWEFLTKELKIDKNKLYVTIYHTDSEAEQIWQNVAGFSVANGRLIKIATDDNFWSMGDVGPCGPCTEIFYDHGAHIEGGLPGTPEEDGDRFVEIWNLVFMQYEKHPDGSQTELPKPSIDTGIGLERLAAVMQNVTNNYEIDYFQKIIQKTASIIGRKPENEALFSFRVIADHLRSVSFLIADGVMPSNEGRGYVLRRIMRRAMRHIHQLGHQKPLFAQLLPTLIELMGDAHPELIRAKDFIMSVMQSEEEKFYQTLDKGLNLLEEEIKNLGSSKVFSGSAAFKLYDTYGFPLDLTTDILKDRQITINIAEFDEAMQQQKERAKASWQGSGGKAFQKIWFEVQNKFGATEFLGYEQDQCSAKVIAIVNEEKGELQENLKPGEKAYIVFDQTVFYAESGGQKGDIGLAENSNNAIKISDTKKFLGNIHACLGTPINDAIKVDDEFTLKIDTSNRNALRANHTATHILHKVLQDVLGKHVTQKGSLVAYDKLRFDFSHMKALTRDEISQIENMVNQVIWHNAPLSTRLMESEKAIAEGAMALFGEKYDEMVRVVALDFAQDQTPSIELCGGTHVKRAGDIGLFKIVSESAIASGIRRIEAVTGQEAFKKLAKAYEEQNALAQNLKTTPQELNAKIDELVQSKKQLEKKVSTLQFNYLLPKIQSSEIKNLQGHKFISFVSEFDSKFLRDIGEKFSKEFDGVALVVSLGDEKSSFIITSGCALNASEIMQQFAQKLNCKSGGGNAKLAQSGAPIGKKDKELFEKAVENLA